MREVATGVDTTARSLTDLTMGVQSIAETNGSLTISADSVNNAIAEVKVDTESNLQSALSIGGAAEGVAEQSNALDHLVNGTKD